MEASVLVKGPITTKIITSYLDKLGERNDSGGHSIFLGQVRADIIEEKKVKAIEYSAYEEMVGEAAGNIKKTILEAFSDVKDIILIHSTGIVKTGQMSLFIMITAGHRDQATRACRHAVEMIKLDFPVWKKEIFEDDSTHWK
jgi:molybdopterin synthase catalytic subunit